MKSHTAANFVTRGSDRNQTRICMSGGTPKKSHSLVANAIKNSQHPVPCGATISVYILMISHTAAHPVGTDVSN